MGKSLTEVAQQLRYDQITRKMMETPEDTDYYLHLKNGNYLLDKRYKEGKPTSFIGGKKSQKK